MLTVQALNSEYQKLFAEVVALRQQVTALQTDLATYKAQNARYLEQLDAERNVSRERDRVIGVIEAERDTHRAEADRLRGKHALASEQMTAAHSELDTAGVPRQAGGVTLTLAERIKRLTPPAYTGPVRKFPEPCEDKTDPLAKGA